MKLPHRRQFLRLAAATAALPIASRAWAEVYPTRPIRVLVTAGPGSAVDVIPRVVFDQLSSRLGQPIVIENRAGAGGTIAAAAVAKAKPDGYTILAASSAHTIAPLLHVKLPYDPVRDLFRNCSAWELAKCARNLASEGLEHHSGLCGRREGEAQLVQLYLHGRWQCDPYERGALSSQCGH